MTIGPRFCQKIKALHDVWNNGVKLLTDRRAVTSLEYGIIASILGLELVNVFKNFGSTLTKLFSAVASSI